MIYNLQEANQTLVYAKKYLDIYSGRLINIKVNARMIRTYVDIYLENEEGQDEKANKIIEITNWVIDETENGLEMLIL